MQNIKTRFISNIIFFCLIYAVMCYVAVRAVSLVMTHDEAYSFYNVKHFWYVETLCTGNTHWFNFLAIKGAVLLGLEKASQLRWFTVFSSGVFLTSAYFWIKSLKDMPTKFFAFALALLNPFLIDYLSLARGYATGLMFESLAILCICIAIKNDKRKMATLSLFFAGMAAIANFNFFYFFAAFCMLYFWRYHLKKGFEFFKQKLFYIEGVYTLGITWLVLRALKFITLCSNDIGDYGGDTLVTSIFTGYIDTLLYDAINPSADTMDVCAYILFTCLVVLSVYGVYTFKKHKLVWYSLSSSILLIIMVLLFINKWSFDVLYPTYRTTLLFYPLIALVIIGFISSIITKKKIKAILLYACSALFFIHFITTINLNRSFDYSQQIDSKLSFDYLKSIGAKKVGIDPFLYGVYRNYYQMTETYKYPFEGESLNTFLVLKDNYQSDKIAEYDYLVLYPPYKLDFYRQKGIRLKGVAYYKRSGTLVVRVLK